MGTDYEHSPPPNMPGLEEFNAGLARLAQNDPFINKLTPALHADTIPLFFVGLHDEDQIQATYILDSRHKELEYYESVKEVYSGTVTKDPAVHRHATARAKRGKTHNQGILADMAHNAPLGLERSPMLGGTVAPLQYLYSGESSPAWQPEKLLHIDLSERDMIDLFGRNELPSNPTFETIAACLRAAHPPDLSRETLDARFTAFIGLTNFALSTFLLADMNIYSRISRAASQRTRGLLSEYRPVIESEDLAAKQHLMAHFSRMLEEHSQGAQDYSSKRAMQFIATSQQNMSADLDKFMTFFTNVYTSRHYELPPLLQPPEEPTPETLLAVGAVTVAVAVTAETDEAKESLPESKPEDPPRIPDEDTPDEDAIYTPDPELVEKLTSQAKKTIQQLNNLAGGWLLSATARKTNGIEPVVKQMVDGLRSPIGTTLLNPIVKDQAIQLVSVLHVVNRLATIKEPAAVQKHILANLQTYTHLRGTLGILEGLAADEGVSIDTSHTQMPNVLASITRLAKDWTGFSQLILKAWPPNQSAGVVREVKKVLALFFPDPS